MSPEEIYNSILPQLASRSEAIARQLLLDPAAKVSSDAVIEDLADYLTTLPIHFSSIRNAGKELWGSDSVLKSLSGIGPAQVVRFFHMQNEKYAGYIYFLDPSKEPVGVFFFELPGTEERRAHWERVKSNFSEEYIAEFEKKHGY